MSDQVEDGSPEDQSESPSRTPEGVDWLFSAMLDWARIGLEMPVTLSVGGQLISGIMCSQTEFCDGVIKAVEGGTGNLKDLVVKSFTSMRDLVKEADGDDDPAIQIYVHLRDARVYGSGNPIPQTGTFWRGKASAIDGFSIGSLNPS